MRTNFLTSAKDDIAKAFFDINEIVQGMLKSLDIATDYPREISKVDEEIIELYLKDLQALQRDNFETFIGLSEL